MTEPPPTEGTSPLAEVGRYFLGLGFFAFGGPAAHIALMQRDLVQRRKWVDEREFIDLLGATNLIPGPNSTEMTMHLGARRAGWWGLWLGGAAFIGPAVLIVLALAWAYVRYGDTPAGEGIIRGIQPFVLAIIVGAIWGLRRAAIKDVRTIAVAAVVLLLAIAGLSEIPLIFGAGFALVAFQAARRWGGRLPGAAGVVPLLFPFGGTRPPGYGALELFLVMLKIGAVLYGSGYVLLAFLRTEFVVNREWLTEQQLIDAIAVGQFTPGPLFSSATFAGYVVGGWGGAAVATTGIFLPSFVFVALTHPLIPRIRQSELAGAFLDGVNAAALALMGFVTFELARETLDDAFGIGLFAAAAMALLRFSPNSALLVAIGASAGLLREFLF
jgi:chromate transporter